MCGEIKIRSKKRKKYLIFLLSTCKVYNLFHYHIACIQQFLTNGCYMFLVSGFHNDTKGTSGDICTLTISLMMYRNYISSLLCDNFADSQQLPRLVISRGMAKSGRTYAVTLDLIDKPGQLLGVSKIVA